MGREQETVLLAHLLILIWCSKRFTSNTLIEAKKFEKEIWFMLFFCEAFLTSSLWELLEH